MVQDQGVLGMPIKRDREFAPLDIIDLGRALISVTFPSNYHPGGSDGGGEVVLGESSLGDTSDIQKSLIKLKLTGSHPYAAHETVSPIPVAPLTLITPAGPGDGNDRHDGQIYTLTGPETVTGPKLADELTRALQSDKKHKDKVTFCIFSLITLLSSYHYHYVSFVYRACMQLFILLSFSNEVYLLLMFIVHDRRHTLTKKKKTYSTYNNTTHDSTRSRSSLRS